MYSIFAFKKNKKHAQAGALLCWLCRSMPHPTALQNPLALNYHALSFKGVLASLSNTTLYNWNSSDIFIYFFALDGKSHKTWESSRNGLSHNPPFNILLINKLCGCYWDLALKVYFIIRDIDSKRRPLATGIDLVCVCGLVSALRTSSLPIRSRCGQPWH